MDLTDTKHQRVHTLLNRPRKRLQTDHILQHTTNPKNSQKNWITFPWRGKGLFKFTSLREPELQQRPCKAATFWLVPHSLPSLFSYRTRTTSTGVALPLVTWALTHQSPIKKMHHRIAHNPVWWDIFSRRSLSQDDSIWGQVDRSGGLDRENAKHRWYQRGNGKNKEGTSYLRRGQSTRTEGPAGQIALRMLGKALRRCIALYLPKITYNTCKCTGMRNGL